MTFPKIDVIISKDVCHLVLEVCFWLMVLAKHMALARGKATLGFGFTLKTNEIHTIVALARPASADRAPSHAIRPSLDKLTVCRLAAAGCALCAIS